MVYEAVETELGIYNFMSSIEKISTVLAPRSNAEAMIICKAENLQTCIVIFNFSKIKPHLAVSSVTREDTVW